MYLHEERKVFRDVIISTSEHMGLPEEIIEKDYYVTMILKQLSEAINPEVKLETALASYAFPTEIKSVGNYVYDLLKHENENIVDKYMLQPFNMKVQSLSRTFVDKIFALCDYYMQDKSKGYSRHLYDLYKLRFMIKLDGDMKKLVIDVREHRKTMSICPSAKDGVDILDLVNDFVMNSFINLNMIQMG